MYRIVIRITRFLFIVASLTGSWTTSLAQVSDSALRGGEVPLERVGAVVLEEGENAPNSAVMDPEGEYVYFGLNTQPGRVVKVDLTTFERVDALTLEDGEDWMPTAVIDPLGEFAYFGTNTSPGHVVKVDLATMERVDGLTLDGVSWLSSAVMDPGGDYAYFGTNTIPGQVVKVDLATLEQMDVLTLEEGEERLTSAVVDPAGEYGYFGTETAPDVPDLVVKVDLGTLERVDAIELEEGEKRLWTAVMDPQGDHAYFGTGAFGVPGRVVKVDLDTFERVGSVTFEEGENVLKASVIDPSGSFALFGTFTNPGRVVMVDLDTFERVAGIAFESGEWQLESAVIDPAGASAYFGAFTVPGRVVKVTISQGEPIADISPDSFDFELEVGDSDTQTLTIGNLGTADLNWSIGATSYTETFDDGANNTNWTWDQTDLGTVEPSGGNPDGFFQSALMAVPSLWSLDSTFTGDYRERAVGSIGGDLRTIEFSTPEDSIYLALGHFNGDPDNPLDNTFATFKTSIDAPVSPDDGWVSFDVPIPADATATPDGWVMSGVVPDLPPTVDWDTLITNVDAVVIAWANPLEPVLLFDVVRGADNLRIAYDVPGSDVAGDCESPEDVSWLSISLETGTTLPDETTPVDVTVDAADLEPDAYTAQLCVTTNDAEAPLVVIPVTLAVEGETGTDDDLAFEGTHRLSPVMPNPAGALATTTLEVADAQDVQVELFDVSGRRVATPFEGAVAARSATEIELGVGVLAPGVYVLRISGETFIETRRFTVVR